MENEIEVYYRWSELDKEHQYSVVCKFSDKVYANYWVGWLWYKMGAAFPKQLPFRLFPYRMEWTNEKLINKYKNINNAYRVPVAILKHFNSLKKR